MNGGKARILVIDDKEQMCAVLKKFLVGEGYAVETAQSAEQALQIMARAPFDLVLSDVRMPGMNGQELLDHLRERGDGVAVILMTAFASIEAAVEALKRGAADYISKPFSMDDVLFKIKRALEERDLRRRVADLERQVAAHRAASGGEIIGNSAAMQRLREIIERVAPIPC
ncbi:response regulator [Pyrinomonas sp.]|mgnify:CR=1 FL=1|uniref:sigma-54-dependent transcriptional regulator n=1 Tax=Pyrinomonas sp. TaxID=2080306 RepID=UPI00332832AF